MINADKSYSSFWVLAPFLFCILAIIAYFNEGIFTVNEWVYSNGGDALKNYFHVLFSAKNGHNLWLDQVNYPFGEHLFYLDAQPLLSAALQAFGLEEYSIGAVNFLPILSISITAGFIFLIQREFKVALVLNVISSCIIAFLSPQIMRMDCHFALGYSLFIPCLIFLLVKRMSNPIFRFSVIAIIIVLFSFLHPYYLLIGTVLVLCFSPYFLIEKFNFRVFIGLAIAIFVPLLLIKGVLMTTDIVPDRPESPYGFIAYRSRWEGVFSPSYKPFMEILRKFWHYPRGTFESHAYVGILGLPFFLLVIVSTILRKIKGESTQSIFGSVELQYLFWGSFFVFFGVALSSFQRDYRSCSRMVASAQAISFNGEV